MRFCKTINAMTLAVSLLAFASCNGGMNSALDTVPPAPVTKLRAVAEEGRILITWKDPCDQDLLGIKVYDGIGDSARSVEYEDAVFVEKGIQKYAATELEDGKSYVFLISAVDEALNESRVSITQRVEFVSDNTVGFKKTLKAGSYTVHHMLQKMNDEGEESSYEQKETQKKTVESGATIKDVCKEFPGYSAKKMQQDGEDLMVFYDLKTVRYTFRAGVDGKFSDGSNEKTVEGLYGSPVKVPAPEKEGASFEKWISMGGDLLDTSYGPADLIFTALWKNVDGTTDEIIDAETGMPATASSKYVYFGHYPQTVLPLGSSVSVDEKSSIKMGANTYYLGSDGNYYAKFKANPRGNGNAYNYSDGSAPRKDKERYFRVEPIKWRVLTTNYNGTKKALLLAEDILSSSVPFSESEKRMIGGVEIFPNNYRYSTIRAYLNGSYEVGDTQSRKYEGKGFLQTAFTESEAALICTTTVVNNARSTSDSSNKLEQASQYACQDTQDKLFLLSEQEVTTNAYGFTGYRTFGVGNSRVKDPTDFAKADNAFQNSSSGYGGYWMLRSPHTGDGTLSRVIINAGDGDYMFSADSCGGLVPALTVTLK